MTETQPPDTNVTPIRRSDNLSPFSLFLLALIVVIQILSQFNLLDRLLGPFAKSHASAKPEVRADIKDILQIDAEAKYAYMPSLATKRLVVDPLPDKAALVKPLGDAEEQLHEFPSDRDVARRVMILRAEVGRDPLAPVSASHKQAAVPPPLDAFDFAKPGQEAEAGMWRELFTGKQLAKKADADSLATRIRAKERLRWYASLALHQLWLRAGEPQRAAQELKIAERESAESLIPIGVMYALVSVVGLVGVTFLIGLGVRGVLVRDIPHPGRISMFDAFAMPLPSRIEDDQRRLGAGDLFNLFVLGIILFVTIGVIEQVVVNSFPKIFAALGMTTREYTRLGVTAGSELIVTLAAIGFIVGFARKRGASLAREIGLSLDNARANIGTGWIGWAISLPLIYGVTMLTSHFLPDSPDPSNPAIALTIHAYGILPRFILYVTICILAPIFEEIMFRGLLYQTARAKLGVWPAIVLSAVVFGLVHPVGIVGSIPLMILGGVFAWLAETRKSLLPGMVAHSLQNTMSFLSMMFLS